VDVDIAGLLVAGVVVIAVLALVAFTVHRLADTNAKKIAVVVAAIVVVLGALPPLIYAFLGV
jgi:uncharacterized membrane protein YhaH (DUF805 family)